MVPEASHESYFPLTGLVATSTWLELFACGLHLHIEHAEALHKTILDTFRKTGFEMEA